jgi:hypothetical protein
MDLRGFNDAVNGFADDGWSLMGSDGVEDVTIMINSSPNKFLGSQYGTSMFSTFGGGVLCAKASMLLQVIPCTNQTTKWGWLSLAGILSHCSIIFSVSPWISFLESSI